jgi:hypothetical protein
MLTFSQSFRLWIICLALAVWLAACSLPGQQSPTQTPAAATLPPIRTLTSQATSTTTARKSATPTTLVVLKSVTPAPLPTSLTHTKQAGLVLRGRVYLADGTPLEGVSILRAFAGYPGTVVAQSNADGYFESPFQPIPGDENTTVWAEKAGYTFTASDPSCKEGKCNWRHYYGFEDKILYFIAQK